MYVIAASPMAKIFQTYKFLDKETGEQTSLQKKCILNPDFILDEEPFTLSVKRPSGGLEFTYKVPKDLRDIHGSDEKSICDWLTGGALGDRSNETDMYGIVEFRTDYGSMEVLNELTRLEVMKASASEDEGKAIQAKQNSLQHQATSSIHGAVQEARKIADKKVRRIMRHLFENLKAQSSYNKDQGIAPPTPSDTEFLSIQMLEKELDSMSRSAKERRQKVQDIFDAMSV